MDDLACLICGSIIHRRRLCNKHYILALKAIKAGKTTWEKEIAAGRAGEAKKTTIISCFGRKNPGK